MKLYRLDITPADNGWIIKERRKEKVEDVVDNDDHYYDDYKYSDSTKVFGTIDNALSFLKKVMNEN